MTQQEKEQRLLDEIKKQIPSHTDGSQEATINTIRLIWKEAIESNVAREYWQSQQKQETPDLDEIRREYEKAFAVKQQYRKIKFDPGVGIESAVKDLQIFKERGELVYGEFNGQKLFSDVDDLQSAYKKITGKTKEEYDAEVEAVHERYKAEQQKHEEAIPVLTKEWINKGNDILDKKYHEKWAKCVPIRLNDLYKGMELGATIDIVKELNSGCELETAKGTIESQGHSGMSFSLVLSMVKSFCDRGEEFVRFVQQPKAPKEVAND